MIAFIRKIGLIIMDQRLRIKICTAWTTIFLCILSLPDTRTNPDRP